MDANEEVLKTMPPPLVALQYYKGDDLYMFDEFQTGQGCKPRRPPCRCPPESACQHNTSCILCVQ